MVQQYRIRWYSYYWRWILQHASKVCEAIETERIQYDTSIPSKVTRLAVATMTCSQTPFPGGLPSAIANSVAWSLFFMTVLEICHFSQLSRYCMNYLGLISSLHWAQTLQRSTSRLGLALTVPWHSTSGTLLYIRGSVCWVLLAVTVHTLPRTSSAKINMGAVHSAWRCYLPPNGNISVCAGELHHLAQYIILDVYSDTHRGGGKGR